jgi:prophage DNA circulation protein
MRRPAAALLCLLGSVQAFFIGAHHLADLVTILGSVWIVSRTVGVQLWKLVEAIYRVKEEFEAMRSSIQNLSGRVAALENTAKDHL